MLGQDLDNLLQDLDPTPTPITPPTDTAAVPKPVKTISSEKIIRSLREIQRLSAEILAELSSVEAISVPAHHSEHVTHSPETNHPIPAEVSLGTVVEGRFGGEKMIGDDANEYNVPPNYASKSKLVVGDRMKLTITHNGAFIYKQIGPIERKRVIGTLLQDLEHNRWLVETPEARYRVLPASISFYKGKPGDEVVLFVPAETRSEWGAVDQLIAK